MRHRWKAPVSLVVLIALFVGACAGDSGDDTTTTAGGSDTETTETTETSDTTETSAATEPIELVSVHGSSPDFIAVVPTAAWDACAERNINVTQEYVEDGSIAIQAIAQGEAQIATNIGVNVGLLAVDQGAPIVDVMTTQRPTWALVSRNEIATIEDLAGLTMGVHGETSFTKAIADFYDERFSLGMSQVIIPGSEVRAEALANDQIDASVIDLPDIVSLSANYPGSFNVLETIGETLPDLIEQDIWMNSDWVAENPETAADVVTCIIEGLRRLIDDPAYALSVATEMLPDEDTAVLEELITEYAERDIWNPNGFLTRETAQFTIEFFSDLGEIDVDPATIDLEAYFNFGLLESALEALGRR